MTLGCERVRAQEELVAFYGSSSSHPVGPVGAIIRFVSMHLIYGRDLDTRVKPTVFRTQESRGAWVAQV